MISSQVFFSILANVYPSSLLYSFCPLCLVLMFLCMFCADDLTSNAIDLDRISKHYRDRIEQIKTFCHEHDIPGQNHLNARHQNYKRFHLNSINVDLHYCSIGKVGGGTWIKNLNQIKKDESHSFGNIFNLQSPQSLSFVFVRNPISRLASAYYDKMYRNWSNPLKTKLDSWPTRKFILKEYRHLTGEEAIADTKVITEQEFAMFIIDNNEDALNRKNPNYQLIDPHWRPQTAICPFCSYNFNINLLNDYCGPILSPRVII